MTVLFYGNVQEYTFNEKSLEVESARSMRALIDSLGAHFGESFRAFLLGDETCMFLVNGHGLMTTGGLDTPLRPGDTVEVLPFVEGG